MGFNARRDADIEAGGKSGSRHWEPMRPEIPILGDEKDQLGVRLHRPQPNARWLPRGAALFNRLPQRSGLASHPDVPMDSLLT